MGSVRSPTGGFGVQMAAALWFAAVSNNRNSEHGPTAGVGFTENGSGVSPAGVGADRKSCKSAENSVYLPLPVAVPQLGRGGEWAP